MKLEQVYCRQCGVMHAPGDHKRRGSPEPAAPAPKLSPVRPAGTVKRAKPATQKVKAAALPAVRLGAQQMTADEAIAILAHKRELKAAQMRRYRAKKANQDG